MKRMMIGEKKILYYLLIIVLVGSSIFLIPRTNVFSEIPDNTTSSIAPPSTIAHTSSINSTSATNPTTTITINSPIQNEWLKEKTVVVSGNYAVNDSSVSSESDFLFSAYENDETDPKNEISNSDTNSAEWIISKYDPNNPNGTWTFTKTLSEGIHTYKIKIEEKNNPLINSVESISFVVGDRPFISNPKIIFPDKSEHNAEDLTSVPTKDIKIKVTLTDNKPMTKFENDALAEPINVKQGTTTVSGTLEKKSNDPDIGVYTLIFTPSEDLALNSTYLVYIDPKLVDDDNNPVFPIQFKFTTKSNMSNKNNPHGNYLILTNGQPSEDHTYLCANCHSTHIGSNPSLEGGIYKNLPSDPNLVTWASQNGLDYTGINQNLTADPSRNYCMACHDGTMNAPIVDNIDKTYHHSTVVDNSSNKIELKNTDTCTTCHNPHLTWTEDNPNMLKDHYIYTSNKDATKKIDSLDVSCQSCHGDNPVYDINEYTNSEHHVLSYKKSSTADGRLNNYSLCLRCHKTDENKNIEQYYTQTNSGHYFTIPQGQKTNDDGSKLNGPIPCAECHDTHGSNNVKMLRENLGNVQTKDLYTKTIGEFTVSDENQFCLKCHNNSTAIYGRVGKFKEKNENGQPITGHQQEDLTTVRCSECHGGDSKTFIEASHAPKPVPTTR